MLGGGSGVSVGMGVEVGWGVQVGTGGGLVDVGIIAVDPQARIVVVRIMDRKAQASFLLWFISPPKESNKNVDRMITNPIANNNRKMYFPGEATYKRKTESDYFTPR
jgi:hypothetical protein